MTITRGIQVVLGVERQYTAWNGVIPGPFYCGIPSLTIVYHGKLLSFSTRAYAEFHTGFFAGGETLLHGTVN